jgi:glucose-1-phosphate adenylyltransferase
MSKPEYNDNVMLARQLPLKSVALILAGGRGTRLKDLTAIRAKPAVHFGGKFRIIDFALSNCINSGIRRIGVITQYQSHSLVQHIQRGWSFLNEEMNEFVDLLPAQQRVHGESWYRGTADAVTQNLDIIRRYGAEYVVILAGDHIYKQDYSRMLIDHVKKGARCTVACLPVPVEDASAFGVMAVDENDKIIDFIEKPSNPPTCRGIKPNRLPVWGSMYSMLNTSISYWMKMAGMNSPATISAKILFQQLRHPEKPGHILSRAPVCSQIIMQNRTGVMSARWRPTGKRTLI